MSNTKILIKPHEYYDSVRLMQVSESIRKEDGVQEAILMMATDNNKKLLDVAGLFTDAVKQATPDDLVIAIVADNDNIAAQTLEKAENLLTQRSTSLGDMTCRTLDTAQSMMPDANLALISVPGEYAAAEARRALDLGLNVMLFSDNVSLDDEVELKKIGRERDLLVMGPDCGTAIINQVGLGFANVVKRGPVGIVGASGTGIQEISVLLDRMGVGISHAIGTGGRDLKAAVGGMTMLMGLELLAGDDETQVIVLTSKPPDATVSEKILEKAAACSKPVVVNFLGGYPELVVQAGLTPARSLAEAAVKAARLASGKDYSVTLAGMSREKIQQLVDQQVAQLKPGQRYLRGLYTGGTLCYEAMLVLDETIGGVNSNIPLKAEYRLQDSWRSQQHTLVDLGDDEFTQGRAHPMIDPTLRNQRLVQEANDPETAVILLDVVLGFGSHTNPAGELVETIKEIRESYGKDGRYLVIVASVCGTDADPQEFSRQKEQLENIGVVVASSNAEAAAIASAIVGAIVRAGL